ncbi:MAG: hypothetical protein WCD21_22335 [Streptomyces sp.]
MLTAALFAVTVLVPTATAQAPTAPLQVSGGTTEFRLSDAAAKTLADHQISFQPVAPATALPGTPGGVAVKVKSGKVTPVPFSAALTYGEGGCRFSDDKNRTITFTDGQVDLGAGTASVVVNGNAKDRIDVATFAIDPAKVKVSPPKITISGTDIKISAAAAVALNLTFGADLFHAGDPLFDHSSSLDTVPVSSPAGT